MTLPLATFEDIESVMKATFDVQDPETGSFEETIKCPGIIVVANMFDYLAVSDRMYHMLADTQPERWASVVTQVVAFVVDLDRFAASMERHFKGLTLVFATPPGYVYWPYALQLFARAAITLAEMYGRKIVMPAPNLQIDQGTLRPADVSVPAYLAGLSKLLLGVTKRENFQLTTDDAMCWDYGTNMADKLAEASRSGQIPPEAAQAGRTVSATEMARLYGAGWFEVRDNLTNDTTSRAAGRLETDMEDLTSKTIGIAWRRLPTRTLPEMLLPPTDDYPDPTSMSLLTIVLCLQEAADRGWHEETYYSWRWEVGYTLESFCQQHSLDWNAFLFMIAPTWGTTVLAAEVGLTAEQAARYDAVMKRVTLIEVVSYLAVAGVTGFKRGPVRFLQFLLGEGDDIRQLFTYLVHARNSLTWIHGMIDVSDPQG